MRVMPPTSIDLVDLRLGGDARHLQDRGIAGLVQAIDQFLDTISSSVSRERVVHEVLGPRLVRADEGQD